MTSALRGVRVVCFYPWAPFEPTGAWSRFSSLWKFLLEQEAIVTLAFQEKGAEAKLRNLSVKYLGDFNVVNNIGSYAQKVVATDARSELRKFSSSELTFLLMYDRGLYLGNPRFGPWVDQLVQENDIVTCEYPMFAPFLSDICKKRQKPLIVTSHDILYELHGKPSGARERLKQKELQALGLADALFFCNEAERKIFEGHGLKGLTVLNTGDVLGVLPGQEEQSKIAVKNGLKIKTPHYTLFVGSAHGPNHDAVAEIRRMAKTVPETTFIVAGNCSARAVDGNFIATGPVSEQYLDTLYRGAALVLVPLTQGTGISVKVFQACIYQKAIVSTPIGSRGYSLVNGEDIIVVPTLAEFPTTIRRLLADTELGRRISQNARAYALRLDYRTHFQPYADVIRALLMRNSPVEVGPKPKLVLVDNNLSDRVGHHYNYALSIKQECITSHVPFVALIKASAADDVRSALDGEGVFSIGIHEGDTLNPYPAEWGSLRSTYDFLQTNDYFSKELESGLHRAAATSDLIFLPNATPGQILGVALFLRKNPIYSQLRFVLILRYSVYIASGPISDRKISLDKETAERYALSIDRLVSVDQTKAVRFASDSVELAKEYQSFSKASVEVLPIPHTAPELSAEPVEGIPPKTGSKIRIVYLGDARDEKGFELLPAIVRACANGDIASRVEFVFQAFISSPYHYKMAPTIDELSKLKLSHLHLIRSSLFSDAYHSLLKSADLVLLPYDALTYRARTSGPFVEAICAGKPVVVPKQSWMSAQLADSGAGQTFNSGNAQDFVRAALTVIANHADFSASAETLGIQFRAFHNPRNFLEKLMQLEPAAPGEAA